MRDPTSVNNQKAIQMELDSSMVRILFRCMAIALGGLHAYAAIESQSMNADGIAYLDIGDAYFRADWSHAINAVWSPLYSWILGLVTFFVKPAMEWEFPTVHLVNFLIYLIALASFEFLWSNVRSEKSSSGTNRLPEPFWWALGYLLFIWTSLSLIQIWSVTPDMLMAAFVFLAAGIVARIRSGDDGQCLFLSLGLVLGLGYLSKTFMFSLAPIFLGLAWLVQKRRRASFIKILLATSVFLIVSVPFIVLISNIKGKFTIGEAGTVTYVRHVLGIPYPHWQGDSDNNIVPIHASRIVHESPPVYEFGGTIGGTYPITTDPSYWYEGIDAPFRSKTFLPPLFASSLYYLDLFFQKQGVLVSCVAALYLMGSNAKQNNIVILTRWALVIPAVIAFGLYGLVLVAGRYIGVFVLLFWADVLANIQLPDMPISKSLLKALSMIAVIGLLANIVMFNLDGFNRLNPSQEAGLAGPVSSPAKSLEVAQALKELGLKPHEKVGVIGYAYDSFWARLARVEIVAEMLGKDAANFWLDDRVLQQEVLQSFASTGARAVVAEDVPPFARMDSWFRVGHSNYFIYYFGE